MPHWRKDPHMDRLASFFLDPAEDSKSPADEDPVGVKHDAAQQSYGKPSSDSRFSFEGGTSEGSPSGSAGVASCLIDGRVGTRNFWRWKVQQLDPKLLELPNLCVIMDKLNSGHTDVFDLRLPKGRLASVVLQHCVAIVAATASRGTRFKIGLTTDPFNRWFNESFGYVHQAAYSCMTIISILRTMEAATYLEAAVIREFLDHALCDNQASGGEGAIADASPAFIYVVTAGAHLSATKKQRRS